MSDSDPTAEPGGPPPDPSAPDPSAAPAPAGAEAGGGGDELTVDEAAEVVEHDLEALLRERDEYLEGLRRVQAEFENYRKRVMKQQAEQAERAAESLVGALLPVLDACEAAVGQGVEGAEPLAGALFDVLGKEGLVRIDAAEAAFDPERHEAVAHEPGEGVEPAVAEVLRTGYEWKGRVLRPAMVKVKG